VDIKWFGHSCFRLKDRNAIAFTDPFPLQGMGYSRPKSKADIVTISQQHPLHASLDGFTTTPYVISRPGEYEVNGIFVTSIRTQAKAPATPEQRYNNVMLFQFDDLSVCHLGNLTEVLGQDEVEQLSEVDVLLVPVGGNGTLNASQAAEIISLVEPYYVIPMHFRTDTHGDDLDPVDRFLKEMGVTSPTTADELRLTRSSLPEETQVVVLNYN
jgi:L-ascorbate metabolism protein UlaG (beta-lactamase superfamily)